MTETNFNRTSSIPFSENSFKDLAVYYDVTHQWRDYAREVLFISETSKRLNFNGVKVLDIACGTGEHSWRLASEGFLVTGIDRSKEMLTIAKNKSRPGVRTPQWREGDIFSLLEANLVEFDMICCIGLTANFVLSIEKMMSFLKNIGEKLTPGGLLFLDFINPWRLISMGSSNLYESRDEKNHIYILEKSTLNHSHQIRHNDFTWFVKQKNNIYHQYKAYENLRVWFMQELCYLLKITSFNVLKICSEYNWERFDLQKDFNLIIVASNGSHGGG